MNGIAITLPGDFCVLIVDRNRMARAGLCRFLQSVFTVHIDFVEVDDFESISTLLPSIRLSMAIVDQDALAGISDVEQRMFALRAISGEPVVVVLGNRMGIEYYQEFKRYGVAAYIPKSAPLRILAGAIFLALLGGCYAPPEMIELEKRAAAGIAHSTNLGNGLHMGQIWTGGYIEHESGLTPRQLEVLRLLVEGYSNKEISRKLEISLGTVKNHVAAVLSALNVHRRSQLIRRLYAASLQEPKITEIGASGGQLTCGVFSDQLKLQTMPSSK